MAVAVAGCEGKNPLEVSKAHLNYHGGGGDEICSSNHCCSEQSLSKMPSVFDIVKAGLLVPLQTLVEAQGVEVLSKVNEEGETLAHWACLKGHKVILTYMMELKAPINECINNGTGQRPIHWACVNGRIAVVELLLTKGVPVDIRDHKGCTPLIVAAQYGQTSLAAYLIGKGAALYLTDVEGDTALHWAAFKGHNELMRMLIYLGLNPNQQDHWGQMPLHLSCINGNLTAVQELCELDRVDINVADKKGKTPLMLAIGRKHVDVIIYLRKEQRNRSSLVPRIDFRSIIFGPPGQSKAALLFVVFCLLFYGYPVYIFKCVPMTWLDLEMLHIIFLGLSVLMWTSLYCSCKLDPGFVPQNVPEYDEALRQMGNSDSWQQGCNPLSKLCHTCRTVKPIRSKHCRTCNRCVLMFDHHCPYIYNCVGFNNRVWFMGFVCSVVSLCIIGNYFAAYIVWHEGWSWIMGIGLVMLSLFTLISVPVLFISIFQAILNITSNERLNWRRYKYLQDGKGRYYNPFNRGTRRNILEFLYLQPAPPQSDVEFLNVTVI